MKQLLTSLACLPWLAAVATAAPDYNQITLESVFPQGGQRGTTVQVELIGGQGGLK
ncbi:MAG: hypothetical protein HQ518_30880 [Rhodopirellula sp.]|nr:hypothetical protein [Rhodopirellula sp.]